MTTTLAALAVGSLSYKWVLAIEGYQYLLTDATTAAAVTAWSGTNHGAALGGLYVRPSYDQQINPWQPFENSGGSLTFQVVQTSTADTFGVDTHLKSGGNETLLTATLDCDDTTATVKSTATFASSGTVYIGSEACTYSGTSATTFTGLSRGVYAPFDRGAGTGFAHPHEIATDTTSGVSLNPVVSSTPRSWIGKWVGLWQHQYNAGTGLLNVKDDALLTFAGRIVEVRDNATTMTTDVEVEHALAGIRRAVLGDDMWSATIKEGVWLAENKFFTATDFNGTTVETADHLVVVASGATGAYQMNEGLYTYGQILDKVNNWLATALTDGDLHGTYTFTLSGTAWNAPRTQLKYRVPGAATNCVFAIGLPEEVERMFGTFSGSQDNGNGCQTFSDQFTGGTVERVSSVKPPLRHVNNNAGWVVELVDEAGTFVSQTTLPSTLNTFFTGYSNLGLVIIDGKQTAAVSKSGSQFVHIVPWLGGFGGVFDQGFEIAIDDPRGPIKVQQYFHIVGTFADVIKQVFLSSGTAGYNHATYDTLPASISLGIPFDVLGANFLTSVDQLAHSDVEFALIITKPTKLEDAIGGALKLRFAFLRWIEGGIQFWSWMTPTTGDLLQESNKASPAGTEDEQRIVTRLSDEWARNVVKIDYDRDFTANDSGGAGTFHKHLTIIDRAGIDDAGGQKRVETIADQSSYSQWFLGGAGGVEAVLPYFKEIVPMFTRPVRISKRTIDPRFFEGYSVGDCVLVTDEFARDPDTGIRGVSVRPGIIVAHGYEPGGFTPDGSVADMHGEVSIMFLDLLRVGPYVPCADVDYGAANGGLDAATEKIFTCLTGRYGVTGDAADATYINAGDKIRIIEVDPADPAAPLSWDRVVDTQTGNATIAVTVAIGSPAWDASKRYRIISDDYGDAAAAQQLNSYQADDADGRIADTRAPYQYTANTSLRDWPPTAPGESDGNTDVTLPPNSGYGDGVGLDVGHHNALNSLINNLIDYKTARSSPFLTRTVFEVDGTGDFPELDVWKLRAVMPIFLSGDGLSATVARSLYVALHWRSSTGNSVSARITLAREMPTVTNTDGSHIIGPDNYGQVTFTSTSSTYATPTAQAISIGSIKDSGGVAYVLIEMFVPTASFGTKAQSYGLGTCYEGPRT